MGHLLNDSINPQNYLIIVIAAPLFLWWNYGLLNRQYFHCKYFPTNVSNDRGHKKFLPTCTSQQEVSHFMINQSQSLVNFSFQLVQKKKENKTKPVSFFLSCSNFSSGNLNTVLSFKMVIRVCIYTFPDVTASGGWAFEWCFFLNREFLPLPKHSIWGIWTSMPLFSPQSHAL